MILKQFQMYALNVDFAGDGVEDIYSLAFKLQDELLNEAEEYLSRQIISYEKSVPSIGSRKCLEDISLFKTQYSESRKEGKISVYVQIKPSMAEEFESVKHKIAESIGYNSVIERVGWSLNFLNRKLDSEKELAKPFSVCSGDYNFRVFDYWADIHWRKRKNFEFPKIDRELVKFIGLFAALSTIHALTLQ